MTALAEQGAQMFDRWGVFCAALLAEDPAWCAKLREALTIVGHWADAVYPFFEEGETVAFSEYGRLDFANEASAQMFVDLTGDIMFNGLDGPRNAEATLQRCLDALVAGVARGSEDPEWRRSDGG